MTDGTEHQTGPAAPGNAAYQQAPRFGSAPPEPDWQAMADRHQAGRRRRKRWLGASVAVVGVVAVAAGTVAVRSLSGGDPEPSALGSPTASPSATPSATPSTSASPSRAPVTTPTVPGKPNVLADHTGQADLPLGPDAGLKSVSGGYALSLRGDAARSYAQSDDPVVDTTAGFTVSAWVYNNAANGSRSAISAGDGASSVFDLGRDDANGRKAWVFRVGTAQVRSENAATVSTWTLLTGSYDATAHTVTLYVSGAPAGSARASGLPTGSGPLELGRSRSNAAWTAPWLGVIGHIQVWNKGLSAAEAARVKSSGGAGADAPPIASWLV
ncbi:LamG-like jellyroll fold domain-containing protein [Streptomyces sp. NPDC059373]